MVSSVIPQQPLASVWRLIHNALEPGTFEDNLHNWKSLVSQLDDRLERDRIHAALSASQSTSLMVLQEWWHNRTGDQATPDLWKRWLESDRSGDRPKDEWPEYNNSLLKLWTNEFGYYREQPRQDLSQLLIDNMSQHLAEVRQSAVAIAAAHRLAHQCYRSLLKQHNEPGNGESRLFENEERQRFWAERSISAVANPCGWLDPTLEAGKRFPHYLWDIQNQRTVEVSTFQACPDYVVVSHTWGRWKDGTNSAQVPGVLWRVPCNTIFDVTDLPRQFLKFAIPTKYVWLDLVCIPQGSLGPAMMEIERAEIANQAAIFASAKHAVIWLNHIIDWNGLRQSLNWLSLRYLAEITAGGYQIADLLPDVTVGSSQHTQLAIKSKSPKTYNIAWRHPGRFSWQKWEPSGWFTSLWTLQEVCLQPHMWLCTRDWDIFSVGTKPVALDDIIALAGNVMNVMSSEENKLMPRGVYGLFATLGRTDLINLLEMTRVNILIFGNQRYCKRRRAEAIMSAIGSTRWCTSQSEASSKNEEALLENTFNLAFTEETRQAVGAAFFGVYDLTPRPKGSYRYDKLGRIQNVRASATLMPFTSEKFVQRSAPIRDSSAVPTEDHPSVSSWAISDKGGVNMKQAGLIASWPPSQETTSRPRVKANVLVFQDHRRLKDHVDLEKWLGEFRPNSEKHAVCLLRQADLHLHGVLLERVYLDLDTDSRPHFFKIGNFYIKRERDSPVGTLSFPPATEVDWLVI